MAAKMLAISGNGHVGIMFPPEGAWGVQYPLEWPKIGNICYFDQEI
jgi:hypothetical protein